MTRLGPSGLLLTPASVRCSRIGSFSQIFKISMKKEISLPSDKNRWHEPTDMATVSTISSLLQRFYRMLMY